MLRSRLCSPATQQAAERWLAAAAQAAQDAATVGRIICEKAVQLQADKVIIGCGGCSSRSKLAQLLSGHVSTYCRQHCSVPLVVVAAQDGGGGHVAHEVGGGGGAA
jgi:nucleotide-binding universal stress UspA family protein